jgi:hypothetical protein
MVLNTALESAKSLKTARADVPRLDDWSQRNESAKKAAEASAILSAKQKRDFDAIEATRIGVIKKVHSSVCFLRFVVRCLVRVGAGGGRLGRSE